MDMKIFKVYRETEDENKNSPKSFIGKIFSLKELMRREVSLRDKIFEIKNTANVSISNLRHQELQFKYVMIKFKEIDSNNRG